MPFQQPSSFNRRSSSLGNAQSRTSALPPAHAYQNTTNVNGAQTAAGRNAASTIPPRFPYLAAGTPMSLFLPPSQSPRPGAQPVPMPQQAAPQAQGLYPPVPMPQQPAPQAAGLAPPVQMPVYGGGDAPGIAQYYRNSALQQYAMPNGNVMPGNMNPAQQADWNRAQAETLLNQRMGGPPAPAQGAALAAPMAPAAPAAPAGAAQGAPMSARDAAAAMNGYDTRNTADPVLPPTGDPRIGAFGRSAARSGTFEGRYGDAAGLDAYDRSALAERQARDFRNVAEGNQQAAQLRSEVSREDLLTGKNPDAFRGTGTNRLGMLREAAAKNPNDMQLKSALKSAEDENSRKAAASDDLNDKWRENKIRRLEKNKRRALEAAVRRGGMTREEADRRMKEFSGNWRGDANPEPISALPKNPQAARAIAPGEARARAEQMTKNNPFLAGQGFTPDTTPSEVVGNLSVINPDQMLPADRLAAAQALRDYILTQKESQNESWLAKPNPEDPQDPMQFFAGDIQSLNPEDPKQMTQWFLDFISRIQNANPEQQALMAPVRSGA